MNTIFDLQQYAMQVLKDTYDEREIRSLCSLIFQYTLHYTNIEIHLKKHEQLDKSFINKFLQILEELKTDRPIQYILGETEFMGLCFKLNENTLIPRPETEEVVMRVVNSGICMPIRLLDIGTGSGCIAIALAKQMEGLEAEGVDISMEAVRQAKENARINGVTVDFYVRDILRWREEKWPVYDVIVSNPPYVRFSERQFMHNRVLNYEPEQALFVSDEDPLVFYRTIADFAMSHLRSGGSLFFEINEALGNEMINLLSGMAYEEIKIEQDIHGKDRILWAKKR
ncbi:peptide chain release factor N(5)-glutamine methyltransferase [Gabonibacter chumensis]|uniref:peptide chain release factor N(5)-glutamine methyltransferase n=1 Tax=Gabonibacter chumensis TaxID=2972474 RepID=UPI0025746D80|nr:peptide chain release factor N(5)-glutamine methyltransferase [Gabonibacter chumensis]MCR9011701.1 peptide chain release factor N(5)-glutamine methyltransferase [Gabonibacter chumensis]